MGMFSFLNKKSKNDISDISSAVENDFDNTLTGNMFDTLLSTEKATDNIARSNISDITSTTGKDFEFLIQGDIQVFSEWDNIMTPKSITWEKIEKDNWNYYIIGNDEYSYSIEPSGIQMTFNNEISYSKAKQIAEEVIENINTIGQKANLVVLNKSNIYNF